MVIVLRLKVAILPLLIVLTLVYKRCSTVYLNLAIRHLQIVVLLVICLIKSQNVYYQQMKIIFYFLAEW
jgi:hypothetical protein